MLPSHQIDVCASFRYTIPSQTHWPHASKHNIYIVVKSSNRRGKRGVPGISRWSTLSASEVTAGKTNLATNKCRTLWSLRVEPCLLSVCLCHMNCPHQTHRFSDGSSKYPHNRALGVVFPSFEVGIDQIETRWEPALRYRLLSKWSILHKQHWNVIVSSTPISVFYTL